MTTSTVHGPPAAVPPSQPVYPDRPPDPAAVSRATASSAACWVANRSVSRTRYPIVPPGTSAISGRPTGCTSAGSPAAARTSACARAAASSCTARGAAAGSGLVGAEGTATSTTRCSAGSGAPRTIRVSVTPGCRVVVERVSASPGAPSGSASGAGTGPAAGAGRVDVPVRTSTEVPTSAARRRVDEVTGADARAAGAPPGGHRVSGGQGSREPRRPRGTASPSGTGRAPRG